MRVNTPRDSVIPANKTFDVLGGTPTLLRSIAIPGKTANTADAAE